MRTKKMDFNKPEFIRTNGIRMAVYQEGSGFPVVLCHGFPELAFSWRHQIPALSRSGFHVLAPDQRGYGRTDRPEEVADYDSFHLCNDLTGLLDAFKIDRAVFCGHDWGGFVVWQMALLHPERVAGVIGVNAPFLPRAPQDPIETMRRLRGESMYIVQFQEPGKADRILGRNVERTFRFFFRKRKMTSEEFGKQRPEAMRALGFLEELEAWDGRGELVCSENALSFYVATFQKTGFTGGINWYRNITRNWTRTEGVEQIVRAPSLVISTTNDIVLPPSLTDGMERSVPDLEKHLIADCGHWTQQEKPEELNAVIIDWLKRRIAPVS
jgi:pimeloyl-ACP methyl ester carboxylesterase